MHKLNKLKKVVASTSARAALLFLILMAAMALFAPFLGTQDPTQLDPSVRLQPPSAQFWLGTDALGRDLYSRVVYGAQVSFMVGFGVLAISVFFGVILGSLAGYFRRLDSIIMRVMDGVMAIPGILLAIALVSVSGASLTTVLIAIAIPEIPRMTRLVRGVILSVRSEPYVEAAMTVGTSAYVILSRHMFPNTFAPLIVQGTYVFASAVLLEAILSFLGGGHSAGDGLLGQHHCGRSAVLPADSRHRALSRHCAVHHDFKYQYPGRRIARCAGSQAGHTAVSDKGRRHNNEYLFYYRSMRLVGERPVH